MAFPSETQSGYFANVTSRLAYNTSSHCSLVCGQIAGFKGPANFLGGISETRLSRRENVVFRKGTESKVDYVSIVCYTLSPAICVCFYLCFLIFFLPPTLIIQDPVPLPGFSCIFPGRYTHRDCQPVYLSTYLSSIYLSRQ